MSDLQPLVLYRYHDGALSPNPWKVVIFFYELNLPWEMIPLDRTDPDIRKKEPVVSISPNGRMPLMVDPNTGAKLWESGAIIEYLLDVYDKDNRLSYTSFPEKYEQSCWKHFQMSGQGPYYGQRSWFLHLHHEQLPSAQSRYEEEIKRIMSVLDSHLAKTGKPYLVGDKVSFADLILMSPSFEASIKDGYPKFYAWYQRLLEMESVKKAQKFTLAAASEKPGAEKDIGDTLPTD